MHYQAYWINNVRAEVEGQPTMELVYIYGPYFILRTIDKTIAVNGGESTTNFIKTAAMTNKNIHEIRAEVNGQIEEADGTDRIEFGEVVSPAVLDKIQEVYMNQYILENVGRIKFRVSGALHPLNFFGGRLGWAYDFDGGLWHEE